MILQGKEIHVEPRLYGSEFAVYLVDYDDRGERMLGREAEDGSIVFANVDRRLPAPVTFTLFEDRAQRLLDELWQAGLRPSSDRQSEGVIAAQAHHLKDMRAIAFAKLEMESPE